MTNDPTRKWKVSTLALMVVLAIFVLPVPTRGASDNTNLIQQILAIVQSIQTILVGTDGSVASLQSNVTAIKAKTDNLPDDTATTLNEIKAGVAGYGPLNRTLMKTFFVGTTARTVIYACASPGPFLLHVHGEGYNAYIDASVNNGGPVHQNNLQPNDRSYMLIGGDPDDIISVRATTPDVEYAWVQVLITMQYAEGQIASCNFVSTT